MVKKCIGQEIKGNIAIQLATNWDHHRLGLTLWPRLLWWRTLSTDQKFTRSPTWQHFCWGVSGDQVSWKTSNPQTRNPTLHRTPYNSRLFLKYNFPSFLSIRTIASNNLVSNWNSQPTNTLHIRSKPVKVTSVALPRALQPRSRPRTQWESLNYVNRGRKKQAQL